MITDAKLDASIRAAVRECSDIDRETLLAILSQELASVLADPETAQSIARVRARLMREFGAT